MNCPNCKQPITDGRKFCTNCGCPADTSVFFNANALGITFTDVLTKKYCCFQGRARRKEYWMFILLIFMIGFAPQILIPLIFAPVFGKFVYFVFYCGMAVPELGVTARRFQDIGKNGWLGVSFAAAMRLFRMITFFLIPSFLFLGGIQSNMAATQYFWLLLLYYNGENSSVFWMVGFLQFVSTAAVFVPAGRGSQPEPNQYGPNPKGL